MKILFITEFFPDDNLVFTGGVEAHNYYLAKQLSKFHKIIVICSNLKTSDTKTNLTQNIKIIKAGPKISKIDTHFLTIPYRLLFLINAILAGIKEDFDIVQGNNFVTYPVAFLVGILKSKPTVAWYPDVFLKKWVKLTGWVSGLLGETTEYITTKLPWAHFIALSQSTKNKLVNCGVNKNRITKIYAGVDYAFFSKINAKKQNTFTICCVSRLVKYKRVDLLVQAIKIVLDRGYKLRVNIIGNGPEANNINALIRQLSLQKIVTLESNLTRHELAKKLKSSHLLCLPSTQEGFGLVVLEAAASGVPYLVSDLPVFREITNNGQGGLFFRKDSVKDLSYKIMKFMDSKMLQKVLPQNARRLALLYSWPEIANQFLKVYKSLINKKLKILVLIDAWFPHYGGGQIHVWQLSKRIADMDHQVTILTRNLGRWKKQYKNIKVVRIGFFKQFHNIFGRIEYLIFALFYSLSHRYDVLHAHAFSPGLIIPIIKIFKKQPNVFTVHGKGYKIAGFGAGGKLLEELVIYKIPYDLEITVAKSTLTKKTSAKKVITIPNGVDIGNFKDAQKNRNRIKNILYIGRLSYEKGADLLIEAFKNLKEPGLNLKIVGAGQELKKLKKLAKKPNIQFQGELHGSKLIKQLKETDLLVIPSRTEGQSLVLLEAWAAKLPVLATRVGDNQLFIKDGVNGFLAEPNYESIKTNLERAIRFKNFKAISNNGYRKVQNYTWDKAAQKTISYYKNLNL